MKELLNKLTVGVLVRTYQGDLQKSYNYSAVHFLDAGGELNTIPLGAHDSPYRHVPVGYCAAQHYSGALWLYLDGECLHQIAALDKHWLGAVAL